MNLDNFNSADYFHSVSMHAELDKEIGKILYLIIDKIDDTSKEAEFSIIYINIINKIKILFFFI